MSHYRKKNPPKPRELDKHELELLEYYAGLKCTIKEIACMFISKTGYKPNLPMNEHQLETIIERQEAARYAWEQGRMKTTLKIKSNLFELANGERKANGKWERLPSERAIEMWGQYQENWSKKESLEITGKDGGPIKTEQVDVAKVKERLKKLTDVLGEE